MSSPETANLTNFGIDQNRVQLNNKARDAAAVQNQIQQQIQIEQERAIEAERAAEEAKNNLSAAKAAAAAKAVSHRHQTDPNEFLIAGPNGGTNVGLNATEFIVKPTYESQSAYAAGHSGTTAPETISTGDVNPNYKPGSELSTVKGETQAVGSQAAVTGGAATNPVAAAVADLAVKQKAANDAATKAAHDAIEDKYIFDQAHQAEAAAVASGKTFGSQSLTIVEELGAKNANNPNYKGEQVGDVRIQAPVTVQLPQSPIATNPEPNPTRLVYSAPNAKIDEQVGYEAYQNVSKNLARTGGGTITPEMINAEKQNLFSTKYQNGFPSNAITNLNEIENQNFSYLSQGYTAVKLADTKALMDAGFSKAEIQKMRTDKSNIGQEFIFIKPAEAATTTPGQTTYTTSEADQLTLNDMQAGRLGYQRLPGFTTDSNGNKVYRYGPSPGRQQYEYVQEKAGPFVPGQELESGLFARDIINPQQLAITPVPRPTATPEGNQKLETQNITGNQYIDRFLTGLSVPVTNLRISAAAVPKAAQDISQGKVPEAPKTYSEAESDLYGAIIKGFSEPAVAAPGAFNPDALVKYGGEFVKDPLYYGGSAVTGGAILVGSIVFPPLIAPKLLTVSGKVARTAEAGVSATIAKTGELLGGSTPESSISIRQAIINANKPQEFAPLPKSLAAIKEVSPDAYVSKGFYVAKTVPKASVGNFVERVKAGLTRNTPNLETVQKTEFVESPLIILPETEGKLPFNAIQIIPGRTGKQLVGVQANIDQYGYRLAGPEGTQTVRIEPTEAGVTSGSGKLVYAAGDKVQPFPNMAPRSIFDVVLGREPAKIPKLTVYYESEANALKASELAGTVDIKGNPIKAGQTRSAVDIANQLQPAKYNIPSSIRLESTQTEKLAAINQPVIHGEELVDVSRLKATDPEAYKAAVRAGRGIQPYQSKLRYYKSPEGKEYIVFKKNGQDVIRPLVYKATIATQRFGSTRQFARTLRNPTKLNEFGGIEEEELVGSRPESIAPGDREAIKEVKAAKDTKNKINAGLNKDRARIDDELARDELSNRYSDQVTTLRENLERAGVTKNFVTPETPNPAADAGAAYSAAASEVSQAMNGQAASGGYGVGGNAAGYTPKFTIGIGGETGAGRAKLLRKGRRNPTEQSVNPEVIIESNQTPQGTVRPGEQSNTNNEFNVGTRLNDITGRLGKTKRGERAGNVVVNLPFVGSEQRTNPSTTNLLKTNLDMNIKTDTMTRALEASLTVQMQKVEQELARANEVPTRMKDIPTRLPLVPPKLPSNNQSRKASGKSTRYKRGEKKIAVNPVEALFAGNPDAYVRVVGIEGSKKRGPDNG